MYPANFMRGERGGRETGGVRAAECLSIARAVGRNQWCWRRPWSCDANCWHSGWCAIAYESTAQWAAPSGSCLHCDMNGSSGIVGAAPPAPPKRADIEAAICVTSVSAWRQYCSDFDLQPVSETTNAAAATTLEMRMNNSLEKIPTDCRADCATSRLTSITREASPGQSCPASAGVLDVPPFSTQ